MTNTNTHLFRFLMNDQLRISVSSWCEDRAMELIRANNPGAKLDLLESVPLSEFNRDVDRTPRRQSHSLPSDWPIPNDVRNVVKARSGKQPAMPTKGGSKVAKPRKIEDAILESMAGKGSILE